MIDYNKKRLDSGFTILELMATLTISTIVFLVAAVVLTTWGLRFQQLSRISKLNGEAYDCMLAIKHGKAIVEDDGSKHQFIGLMNASSMGFTGNSVTYYTENGNYVSGFSGITFKPPKNHSTLGENDEVTITLSQGFVTYNANVYGIDQADSRNVRLFPEDINNRNRNIYVESLVFAPISETYDPDNLDIVRVILKAKIFLSEDTDDLYGAYPNPYSVEYETFIAIDKRKE